jgi:hypothetical protein
VCENIHSIGHGSQRQAQAVGRQAHEWNVGQLRESENKAISDTRGMHNTKALKRAKDAAGNGISG